jgi:hypothetical protein
MFNTYRTAGLPFIYIDLGYWNRKKARSDYGGFHKVVLNARHATDYFQRNRPHDRVTGAPLIEPWRTGGRHIVLAGLSGKGAAGSGLAPLQWETLAITQIPRYTHRPTMNRPKPSWTHARQITATTSNPNQHTPAKALTDAHALVTLHSNSAIDALCAGVPIFSAEGLASVASMKGLEEIETPQRGVFDREQFIADVGYCHWIRAEITYGTVFRCFIKDGMV